MMREKKSNQRLKSRWLQEDDKKNENIRHRYNILILLVLLIMIVFYFDIGGLASSLGRHLTSGT